MLIFLFAEQRREEERRNFTEVLEKVWVEKKASKLELKQEFGV